MLKVKPDYYDSFRCIASECKHSCCVGWEIDIDRETADFYRRLEGRLGDELRANMSGGEEPHFVLAEGERCPFLRSDGLCRLILTLGEEALCEICTEHPRYYNFTDDVVELGLGACCEEVARLILDAQRGIELIWSDDGQGEAAAGDVFALRQKLMELLEENVSCLDRGFEKAAALCGGALTLPEMAELSGFFAELEHMDSRWEELLHGVRDCPARLPGTVQALRIAQYFLIRYFCAGDGAGELTHLRFAAVSTLLICALARQGMGLEEALRLYSSEIEYSDENVGKIYSFLK